MSRDIEERLRLFMDYENADLEFHRLALTMQQIRALRPPPNPAKVTDSRYTSYRREFGDESWELDALQPQYIVHLIQRHVSAYRDQTLENQIIRTENGHKKTLKWAADNWAQIDRMRKAWANRRRKL